MHDGSGATRGIALGALVAVLTVTGHGAVGGALPDLAVLAVLVAPLCGVLAAVARRCAGLPTLLVTLGSGQLALHLLISALEPADVGHAGHDTVAAPGQAMLLAHAVVTLLTALLVRHADAAVAGVVAAWRRLLPLLPGVREPQGPRTAAVPSTAPARRRPTASTGGGTRRGPPVAC